MPSASSLPSADLVPKWGGSRRGSRPRWTWPALQLRHGGLIARQVVLQAVALLPALLCAADDGLLGIDAVAEHDVEKIVVGPTDERGHSRKLQLGLLSEATAAR